MTTRIEIKKLFAQIRLNREKKQATEQERLKIREEQKLLVRATFLIAVLGGIVLLIIWTFYSIYGVTI